MKDIGQRIKYYRRQANLTQSSLGEAVGVSKSTIQKYESGRIASFSQTTITKLADGMGISIDVLVGSSGVNSQLEELILDELKGLDDKQLLKILTYIEDIK